MNNPSEIAREALRQMAMQKIPPTPDHYRTQYCRIAGIAATSEFDLSELLTPLLAALPRETPSEEKFADQCALSFEKRRWDDLVKSLAKELPRLSSEAQLPWGTLVERLVQQWDSRLAGLTSAQKRLALERVIASSSDNAKLYERLNTLATQWGDRSAAGEYETVESPVTNATASNFTSRGSECDLVGNACADILDTVIASAIADAPSLVDESRGLARLLRTLSAKNAGDLLNGLRKLAIHIEYHVEDQHELRTGLLHLLQLVVDNIGELVIDEKWLSGQVEVLRSLVAQPMNIRSIDNAERRLKEVIFRQSHLKKDLVEAQTTIKAMLAGFVDQLSSFAQSTGTYHEKIDLCAKKIGEASDIRQLENVIGDVMRETRTIQLTTQRMHDELRENRQKVINAESRIASLEKELASASEMMRHDPLTGALNRRGLEEVFDKEISRANRQLRPLCLGMVDIDNFKKLNDSLGHDAGDAALGHLVTAVRSALRPQDTVARYGGEEFVVLLPDTELEEARQVLVRVQRELTKHFFMHLNQKVLITFSAGVTQLPAGETREQAIKRADALMYQAKKTGKNKVVAA